MSTTSVNFGPSSTVTATNFVGNGSQLTNLPGPSGTANYVAIYSGAGTLTSEQRLAATRGGTAVDSSAFTGLAKVSTGTWSASTLVNADVASNAAIAVSKLAALTANKIVTTDGSGVLTSTVDYGTSSTASSVVQRDSNQNINILQYTISPTAGAQYTEYTSAIQTTNATPATLFTIATVTRTVYYYRAEMVAGNSTDGTSSGSFILSGKIENIGGTLTIINDMTSSILDSGFAPSVATSSSSANFLIQATGIASTTINWMGRITITQRVF